MSTFGGVSCSEHISYVRELLKTPFLLCLLQGHCRKLRFKISCLQFVWNRLSKLHWTEWLPHDLPRPSWICITLDVRKSAVWKNTRILQENYPYFLNTLLNFTPPNFPEILGRFFHLMVTPTSLLPVSEILLTYLLTYLHHGAGYYLKSW
jgi:hypothetical protein